MKGLLAFAVAVFLGVTGYEAWDYYARVDHPQALLTTEDALATGDTLVLGSLNIEHAVRLEKVFMGTPDTAGAEARGLLGDTTFARLESAGIEPRSDLRHLVFALYGNADREPGYALALLGSFDSRKLLDSLKTEFELSPAPDGLADVWQVRRQNLDSCQWSRPWYLFVSAGLIVASDPERMAGLLERFRAQATAQRDIGRWRGFRDGQLGSLALFIPEQAPNTGNPFIQQPLSKARDELDAFREIYFGVGATPLPFEGRLELMMAGDDSGAARQVAGDWQNALNESKQTWAGQMPTVARLHDALEVRDEQGAVRVSAGVDKAWLQDAAGIPQEFMSLLFSGMGMSVSIPDAGSPPQERLEENPARFQAEITADNLPGYQAEPPFVPEADSVSGPFGIRLTAVEIGDDPDAGIELTVSATHRGIPNLGDARQRVQLYIDSVSDAQGKELLREETCGQERNGLPADVAQPHFAGSLSGEKKVRLKAGVRHADIAAISGHVELLLPVRTESIRLGALDQEQVIDREDVRVVVERPSADTLSYKVYGDSRRVLVLRGLNGAEQVLAGTSSVSGGFLFGEGLSMSRSFAGKVVAAELVLASSDVQKRYAFKLANRYPRASQDEAKHEPVSVPSYSLAQLQREFETPPGLPEDIGEIQAETSTGPFRVALDRVQSFFGLQTGFRVYAPPVPGMSDNLAALALEVTAIEDAGGANLIEAERQHDVLDLSEDWQDKSRLKGQANLRFETRAEPAEIRKVRGELQLRLPRTIASVSIEDINVGARVGAPGATITLKRIDDAGFSLDFGEQQPALVAVNAYNAQGDSLWVPHPQIENRDGRWLGRFGVHGAVDKIELLLATEQEQETFPFELTLASSE
jgi:hypothetical protein